MNNKQRKLKFIMEKNKIELIRSAIASLPEEYFIDDIKIYAPECLGVDEIEGLEVVVKKGMHPDSFVVGPDLDTYIYTETRQESIGIKANKEIESINQFLKE